MVGGEQNDGTRRFVRSHSEVRLSILDLLRMINRYGLVCEGWFISEYWLFSIRSEPFLTRSHK